METPNDLRYTEDHEWVRLEGSIAVVGITDYAQGELGDIVFLELPKPDTAVERGSVVGTIEAVKTVADLYSPVSGKVVEVNEALNDEPETVNRAPYGDGWMVRIEPDDVAELETLMDAGAYRAHVGKED
jgi:glycine cleavage system H protein